VDVGASSDRCENDFGAVVLGGNTSDDGVHESPPLLHLQDSQLRSLVVGRCAPRRGTTGRPQPRVEMCRRAFCNRWRSTGPTSGTGRRRRPAPTRPQGSPGPSPRRARSVGPSIRRGMPARMCRAQMWASEQVCIGVP
jgi:hypothetical protein